MNGVLWRMAVMLTRSLCAEEREAVLGDLQESRRGALPALLEITGLVLRRQAQTWHDWRPWFALIGIAVPVGLLLADFALQLARTYDLYTWIAGNYAVMDLGLLEETGLTLRHSSVVFFSYLLLLLVWSWTGGFALATISGRALWANGAVVCAVWLLYARMAEPRMALLLLWACFLHGAKMGRHGGCLTRGRAWVLVAGMFALTAIAIYSAGWWRAGGGFSRQMAVALILSWPACYLAVSGYTLRKPVLN